jgi:hypothetical protein
LLVAEWAQRRIARGEIVRLNRIGYAGPTVPTPDVEA